MIARFVAATALAALFATAASAQTAVPVGHFDSVELEGGGHVTFHYGAQQHVMLNNGSTQYTKFEIDGDKLVIRTCATDNCPTIYKMDVDIATPSIHGLAISGGGQMEVASGFPAQNKVSVAVRGGGEIDALNISASSADAAVQGGGQIHIHAEHALTAAVNGGGQILYAGNPSVTSAINGGGQVSRDGG
ncbi:MAG TPA: DUF2807 domain-containing protein [Rhizomicrobium sp.]